MNELDCRGQRCPQPVVETRRALLAAPAESLAVLVGDDTARQNVTRMATSLGFWVSEATLDDGFRLILSPGQGQNSAAATAIAGKTVLLLSGELLGSGSDDLGRLLLKNFLFTLTELDTVPDAIYCINAGVKLACQSSEAREALEKLACMGSDVASCGLCLDYYHLKEELAVGRVTNMLDIADNLLKAGRIIRP